MLGALFASKGFAAAAPIIGAGITGLFGMGAANAQAKAGLASAKAADWRAEQSILANRDTAKFGLGAQIYQNLFNERRANKDLARQKDAARWGEEVLAPLSNRNQIDLFYVLKGTVKICAFDGDKNSNSYGQLIEIISNSENPQIIKIPGHLWHGTKNIGNIPSETIYFMNNLYDYDNPDEARDLMRQRQPLGRLGEPEEVCDVVNLLLENDYFNGETININGGLYMK